ncbi:unnamed protein product [Ceutorhynchus assimilis]|uniref:PUM-HD domain-containing protein n=1 Tax=Ceutorhynchus assimilis TaxID=467358 RepID=A0A9N9QK16_9CUCU|nr:unnamed protein product [Ceutorhynchus assimilis]
MAKTKKNPAPAEAAETSEKKVKSVKRKKSEEEVTQAEIAPSDETQKPMKSFKKAKGEGKFNKTSKQGDTINAKGFKHKKFQGKPEIKITDKIEDWKKYKAEKKELRVKRIKARTKDNFDRIQEAKKMGEKVRLKTLKEADRIKVINQLHGLIKGNYSKFVVAHDTARIVQWLLKYSSKILVHQISQELIPVTVGMLQSKYGIHCVKRILKCGEDDVRAAVIDQMKGHAVKLASHTISAPVLEYAFSTYATPEQKQLLVQEFYGDLYKNSKDPKVKHIRDVYFNNENMKAATLGACKSNIKKVLNKSLLDSGLVQTVLSQFLQECSNEDKAELITELAPHIVVISNSREGSKAAMHCIWHGTAKDKKIIIKSLKEHLIELSKHEFGHRTIITLVDSVDDTVLLHKVILSEILKNAKDLAVTEWGRKVLLWLVAPADLTIFHPYFIKELDTGRDFSNSKKSIETRRQEILAYSIDTLLNLIIEEPNFWLSSSSLAMEMVAILKAGSGDNLSEALGKIAETIIDVDWNIQEGEEKFAGIEHAGLHMALKKLAKHDKVATEKGNATFGAQLVEALTNEVLKHWLKINRSSFLLVTVFENNNDVTQKNLKAKLKPHVKLLKSQTIPGAKILAEKM